LTARRRDLWWRRAQRLTATVLVVALIQFVAEVFNPFSMSDAVNARAANVLQAVAAPFYSAPGGTLGQQAVTVVLIDQRYFETIADGPEGGRPSWPLPVRTLTMGILRTIIDANPAALFIDTTFADTPREIVPGGLVDRERSATRLGELLRLLANRKPESSAAHRAPLPLLLAEGFSDGPGYTDNAGCPIRYVPTEDIARRSETATAVREAMFRPGSPPDPLPANLEMVDSSTITPSGYLLAPTRTGPGRDCHIRHDRHEGYIASPALALYRAYGTRCDLLKAPGCKAARAFASALYRAPAADAAGVHSYRVVLSGEGKGHDGAAAVAARVEGTLSPRWGVLMTKKMRNTFAGRAGADVCRPQFFGGTKLFGRTDWFGVRIDAVTLYLVQMFHPVERIFGARLQRPCAFIDTLSAADLLDQRSLSGSGPGSVARDFIKDRIVLLGASIPQVGDRFVSPVSGDLPGIYQHAVALENLVTSGGNYADADGGTWRFVCVVLLTAVLVVAMTALWEALLVVGCRWFGAAGELLLAPLAYYVSMLLVSALAIFALQGAGLPLTATVLPLISLHLVFFARWLERLRLWLDRRVGRLVARWRRRVRAREAEAEAEERQVAAGAANQMPQQV
jgi:hypothetical protein